MHYLYLSQGFQNKWIISVIKHDYTQKYGEDKRTHLNIALGYEWNAISM